MKTFPELYHRTSKGKTNVWNVWADGDSVFTRWGQQQGKMQESSKRVEEKNVGKANATTLEQQAELEAQAMWTHKLERKYVETLDETEDLIFLPMLAKSFEKRKKFLKEGAYPMYGQPKLDGVRCMASWGDDGQVHLMSRSGKEYVLPHICREVEALELPPGDVLDGELYLHKTTLQQLNRLVRGSHKYPESVNVEYHVYDYCKPNSEATWKDREFELREFFNVDNTGKEKVLWVVGQVIDDEEDVYRYHALCRKDGYEGSIMRLLDGVYKFGYRSDKLLKVKSFQDSEFPIIDFTNGDGKFEKCVIYWCQNETKTGGKFGDGRFKVVPKGTFEEREEWLNNAPEAIGEMLKVEFADRSEDNIPLFPIGICIRPEEDMDPKQK